MKTELRQTAKLSEKTVQDAAKHIARKPRKTAKKAAKAAPVKKIKVNEKVWKTALKLANGNARRIKVESATSVIVVNKGK